MVEKRVEGGRSISSLTEVSGEGRIDELVRMLGGGGNSAQCHGQISSCLRRGSFLSKGNGFRVESVEGVLEKIVLLEEIFFGLDNRSQPSPPAADALESESESLFVLIGCQPVFMPHSRNNLLELRGEPTGVAFKELVAPFDKFHQGDF